MLSVWILYRNKIVLVVVLDLSKLTLLVAYLSVSTWPYFSFLCLYLCTDLPYLSPPNPINLPLWAWSFPPRSSYSWTNLGGQWFQMWLVSVTRVLNLFYLRDMWSRRNMPWMALDVWLCYTRLNVSGCAPPPIFIWLLRIWCTTLYGEHRAWNTHLDCLCVSLVV